ncbi:MAG: methionine biosynthesis protein MetW [Victivallaceae bacterium]|nr:methionine biosynthesis protein MetW [Victivallaceae bacterium]MDD4182007.1 methionine biosynthesis protein MetW [Victivallaceae bacterium]
MPDSLRKDLTERRPDLVAIADIIPREEGVRVLDLGCGDGSLLQLLRHEKDIHGIGVEISQDKIIKCIAGGVPVIHMDLDNDLVFIENDAFDYVLLSRTIQAVRRPDLLIQEMLRIGTLGVISFINFGYIGIRWQLMMKGAMPETKTLPDHWFDTDNIHLGTIHDFRNLCADTGVNVVREVPLGNSPFLTGLNPNLFAQTCVFVISRR